MEVTQGLPLGLESFTEHRPSRTGGSTVECVTVIPEGKVEEGRVGDPVRTAHKGLYTLCTIEKKRYETGVGTDGGGWTDGKDVGTTRGSEAGSRRS